MERNRNKNLILLGILLFTVVGISIGFAAFASNLNITSTAEIKPLTSLKVLFSSSKEEQSEVVDDSNIYLSENFSGFTSSIPVINNSNTSAPTLTNLKATFVKPGQSVTYTFYTHNMNTYDTYLTGITFETKSCVAKTGTSQSLVDQACDEIDISVTVGGQFGEPDGVTKTQSTSSDSTVANHILTSGAYENVSITLSYKDLSESGGNVELNGDFDVIFGNVILSYSSSLE